MNYLILSQPDLDRAWQLSAALWQLSSPASVQATEGRETTHWSQPIAHPQTGAVALPLPDSAEFIHPSADIAAIEPFLDETLTAPEKAAAIAFIDQARNSRLSFSQVLGATPSLQDQIKTREQMEANGWFPSDI